LNSSKLKVLFISIAPPENHCGVRVVMYRHLVERDPFEVLVATNAYYALEPQPHVQLRLPYLLHRLRKTRFGPYLKRWITDFENFIWPLLPNQTLDQAIRDFQPDVLLVLADNCLAEITRRVAKRHQLPLTGLFLDWFPIMKGHYGHAWSSPFLSRRFEQFYKACDLAFCTSDGMQEVLGNHPNSHVIYPMPGHHNIPTQTSVIEKKKFRLAYVGSVENFYGRMLCSLIEQFESSPNLEIVVVGPNADWDSKFLEQAIAQGTYLGFKPPTEAAKVLAEADALLVVMSFEKAYELFMRTSFTTKFLDYASFGKPIILWGPDYCTPVKVVQKFGGALMVTQPNAEEIVSVCQQLSSDPELQRKMAGQAQHLHETLFNPDRLQNIFVQEIEKLVTGSKTETKTNNPSLLPLKEEVRA
jgi:glycosyltransferase involved in cell wall biosynthesis